MICNEKYSRFYKAVENIDNEELSLFKYLGFHVGSTTITRAALVSGSPSPPTCVVSKNSGASGPSWKT
jgi:hypothetical protein